MAGTQGDRCSRSFGSVYYRSSHGGEAIHDPESVSARLSNCTRETVNMCRGTLPHHITYAIVLLWDDPSLAKNGLAVGIVRLEI